MARSLAPVAGCGVIGAGVVIGVGVIIGAEVGGKNFGQKYHATTTSTSNNRAFFTGTRLVWYRMRLSDYSLTHNHNEDRRWFHVSFSLFRGFILFECYEFRKYSRYLSGSQLNIHQSANTHAGNSRGDIHNNSKGSSKNGRR